MCQVGYSLSDNVCNYAAPMGRRIARNCYIGLSLDVLTLGTNEAVIERQKRKSYYSNSDVTTQFSAKRENFVILNAVKNRLR